MEGLEVSEIKLSELVLENRTTRIDSEFFKKEYLQNISTLINYRSGNEKLEKYINHISGGATPLGAQYFNKGIPFLRVQNIMQNYFNLNEVVFINNTQDKEIKRSRLKEKDVLLTITGVSFGKSAVVPKELENANINQHLVKITLHRNLNPYFLSTFLNSKFGKLQSDKNIVGVTRPALDYEVIKNFIIPNLDVDFQLEIENTIRQAYAVEQNAKFLYTEAENILLKELGLNNWQPTIKNNNTKTLKESFLSSGRIDAEYYQPKYDEIEEKIINYKGGFDQVKNICNLKTQNFQPQDDVIYNYIELANIGSNGVIKDVTLNEGKDLPSRARRIVKTNDVIVSSVEGSLASCAIIPKEFNNAICSTGFYVINSKNINSETLLLLFKTAVIHLMEKGCSGTILTAINNEEFFKIPLPTIDENIQKTISDKIQQSFALQSKSKQLLEAAKKAVEMAIEQNEEMAMDYLKVIETNIEYATTKSTPSYAHFSELQ
ncbi:MAG: restriction endonuclease subunit S [Pedobacter sp.]|nr:MAG: restriction endonuclease subunit S [Pedobacter sp.]